MLELVLPNIKMMERKGNTGCYEIGPVFSGFSLAFANALRRVLLSSLDGAAITSVKIHGVMHEFGDIADVKEDVPDIVQNLKKVRLRCFADYPVGIDLGVRGPALVTAADIVCPHTVEVVNPEQPIATLDNSNAQLIMNMVVRTGRGFAEAGIAGNERLPLGTIPVDAIYAPVLHVSYSIESIPDRGDADSITLSITTNGTISPDEALRESAVILIEQFLPLKGYRRVDQPGKDPQLSDVPIPPDIYNVLIGELSLSSRTCNALNRAGIRRVGQLLEMDDEEILSLRNVGVKALRELAESMPMRRLLPKGE